MTKHTKEGCQEHKEKKPEKFDSKYYDPVKKQRIEYSRTVGGRYDRGERE